MKLKLAIQMMEKILSEDGDLELVTLTDNGFEFDVDFGKSFQVIEIPVGEDLEEEGNQRVCAFMETDEDSEPIVQ